MLVIVLVVASGCALCVVAELEVGLMVAQVSVSVVVLVVFLFYLAAVVVQVSVLVMVLVVFPSFVFCSISTSTLICRYPYFLLSDVGLRWSCAWWSCRRRFILDGRCGSCGWSWIGRGNRLWGWCAADCGNGGG